MITREDKLKYLSDEQQRKMLEFYHKKKAERKTDFSSERKKNYSKELAPTQKRLWFLQQMDLNDFSYNMPFAIKLTGQINMHALKESFRVLIQNNDSLRMRFPIKEGTPYIEISDVCSPVIKEIQVNHEDEAKDLFKEEAAKVFDLEKGPLYKIIIAKEADDVAYMLFVAHHIIFDGISSSIFIKTLSTIYGRVLKGTMPYYAEKRASYLEIADSENAWLKTEEANAQRTFWEKELEGELPILDFPFIANEKGENIGQRASIEISQELVNKMEQYAGENGITEFTMLLAAYGLLLHKYTHMDDIVIGTPFAGRHNSASYSMVGNFINTLPVRLRFEKNETVREYVAKVWSSFKNVYDNQRLPFDEIVNIVNASRTAEALPVYQTLFVFQNYYENSVQLPGIMVESCFIHNGSTKFDISMSVGKETNKMECVFEYNQSKIPEWMIENMKRHYVNILSCMLDEAETLMKDMKVLDSQEYDEIVYKWNATEMDYQRKDVIYQLFQEQVDASPDATALVYKKESISYRQLDQWTNKIANYLIEKGVRQNQLVGIIMNRSFEMVAAIYGIIKAGAAYVPIDPEYPSERIHYMLENAEITVILSQMEQECLIQQIAENHKMECVYIDATDKVYEDYSCERPNVEVNGKDLLYMIYTSGSTGNPKGVMNTNEALANRVLWMQKEYNIVPKDKVLQKTSYCFDVSVWEFVWPLITGGTLVIAEPGGHRDASYLCKTIVESGINIMHFVPSMLNIFLMDDDVKKCTSLKKVFCSGEALNFASVDKFKKLLPDTEIHNLYGPTEAAIDVTYWDCAEPYERSVIPIGKPIDNVWMYVLDEDLNPVPKGVLGELYIGGKGLARGYYNNELLTNEKFIPNPFIKEGEERIYQTGDIGRLNSTGIIEYYKRKDFQVKLRGQRIELGEIEATLEENEDVEQAAAMVFTDNNGLQNLMAFIVLDGVDTIDEEHLKKYLETTLPKYMIPSFFTVIEHMPLTPNGKVDRKKLQSMIINHVTTRNDVVSPRNEEEKQIFDICKELLGHDQISVTDDLMQIGAYSLLIAKLVYQIREQFQMDISFKYVYENPSIEKIAEYVRRSINVSADMEVDIASDVDAITKEAIEKNMTSNHKANVFLTGATGFVGAFLLDKLQKEYEKVYVLVRAKDKTSATTKLSNNQSRYQLSYDESKVNIVLGDLAKPNLGINHEIYKQVAGDTSLIIHNGALVNYSYPYKLLREANVIAMEQIVRLAVSQNAKEIFFVSSLHIFSDKDAEVNEIIYENSIPEQYKDLKIGYSQSKWAAEKVLQKRAQELGLTYKIFRLGRVGGASDTGAMQTSDFVMLLLKICMQMGKYPDVSMEINYIPVDYVAEFIVDIANVTCDEKIYHIFDERSYTSYEVFELLSNMGIALEKVSMDEWLKELQTLSNASPIESESMVIYELVKNVGKEEIQRTYEREHFLKGQQLVGKYVIPLTKENLQKYIEWELKEDMKRYGKKI